MIKSNLKLKEKLLIKLKDSDTLVETHNTKVRDPIRA